MLQKLCISTFLLLSFSVTLVAEVKYEVRDIDTLQTHSSQAVAINNQGQILGWYNIDGKTIGGQYVKQFFVRDRDGTFHLIANHDDKDVEWKFLKNDGKAYGTYRFPNCPGSLVTWDAHNGITDFGPLPGNIAAINNVGQVLIRDFEVTDQEGNKQYYPAIFENGITTQLRGLVGDLGLESTRSFGKDINDNGDVVGQSLVQLSYKNNIYTQQRPVLWSNGVAEDLYRKIPKMEDSCAENINDDGDIIISGKGGTYLLSGDTCSSICRYNYESTGQSFYTSSQGSEYHKIDKETQRTELVASRSGINQELQSDYDSIWMCINRFHETNEQGEIIGEGRTIYGETHAVLLVPQT